MDVLLFDEELEHREVESIDTIRVYIKKKVYILKCSFWKNFFRSWRSKGLVMNICIGDTHASRH